jgi:hypothetical protein
MESNPNTMLVPPMCDPRLRSLVLSLLAVLALPGCTSDSAQRTAFEALQEVGQEDCRKLPSVECPKRESYDDYQRKRKELESK